MTFLQLWLFILSQMRTMYHSIDLPKVLEGFRGVLPGAKTLRTI